MENKTEKELIDILMKSIDFKNKNQGILSVVSKKKDEEVIVTSGEMIEQIPFIEGDILTIGIYFLDREDRVKDFKVVVK